MLLVVDANELFSLLIRGSRKSEAIFFSNELTLIAPEFILTEIGRHKEDILSKTHRSDFERLMLLFSKRLILIPKEEFNAFLPSAIEELRGHSKDAPYVALALKHNCLLWSEEKRLKKLPIEVLNTKELFGKLFKA